MDELAGAEFSENVPEKAVRKLQDWAQRLHAFTDDIVPTFFHEDVSLGLLDDMAALVGKLNCLTDRIRLGFIRAANRLCEGRSGAQSRRRFAARLMIPIGRYNYYANVEARALIHTSDGTIVNGLVQRLFADARIGQAALEAISETLHRIPGNKREIAKEIEEKLCELALAGSGENLRTAGIALLQQHGIGASEQEQREKVHLRISKQTADLMASLHGKLPSSTIALLNRLFHDYAGPGDLLEDKANDERSADQRRIDALERALKVALEKDLRPTRPGCASVVATVTLQQLCEFNGVALTDVGTAITIDDLLKLGASTHWYLAILDHENGNLLHVSRTKRTADLAMYLGLLASQGGDQTPGSNLPAAACEIHHVRSFANGGETVPNNLMFLSPHTHRLVDDNREDRDCYWTVEAGDHTVAVRRPQYLDPLRQVSHNFNPALWLTPGLRLKHGVHLDPLRPQWVA